VFYVPDPDPDPVPAYAPDVPARCGEGETGPPQPSSDEGGAILTTVLETGPVDHLNNQPMATGASSWPKQPTRRPWMEMVWGLKIWVVIRQQRNCEFAVLLPS
jgi:hypothetical protein